ncbi:MAG: 4Fe-4S binding protein [Euryarchaeota archaeon]|nr:4Fe-4S binding protein [Euryarchaeota archaeon]
MAQVRIIVDLCKGCEICVNVCPRNVFEPKRTVNKYGYLIPEPVRAKDCIKCKLCEIHCPDFAVEVE